MTAAFEMRGEGQVCDVDLCDVVVEEDVHNSGN